MRDIKLDDESIPIWVRVHEALRLINLAIAEAKERGRKMVLAEAAYYSAKATESFNLLEAGYANTFIQQVIKGRPSVVKAMSEYHQAEVEYKNANEAINAYKLALRVLENEQQREYEQEKRMM